MTVINNLAVWKMTVRVFFVKIAVLFIFLFKK